jgi:hypothetical protein
MPSIYDDFKNDIAEIADEGGQSVLYRRQSGESATLVAMISDPNAAENLAAGGFVEATGNEFLFHSSTAFFATTKAQSGDLIEWAGETWRVLTVDPVSSATLWIRCRTQLADA